MNVRAVLAAAGLSLTIASFAASPLFAQVNGAAGASPSLSAGAFSTPPPVMSGASGIFQSAPSAGQPGTEAPASAAPIGTVTSDWMSAEGRNAAQNSSMFPGPQDIRAEKELRQDEVNLERDIVIYRARGFNIGPAAWEKWLGSESLARGDQAGAMRHFQKTAAELRRSTYGSETNLYTMRSKQPYMMSSSQSDSVLHGNETSQTTSGVNLHSNRSSRAVY